MASVPAWYCVARADPQQLRQEARDGRAIGGAEPGPPDRTVGAAAMPGGWVAGWYLVELMLELIIG